LIVRARFMGDPMISTCGKYGDGHWRASFYVTGLAHSILGGSAWEPTVWRAVQRAGWDALKHHETAF
jgi:hypothetical protein